MFECKQETLWSEITTSYIPLNVWLSGYFKRTKQNNLQTNTFWLNGFSPTFTSPPDQALSAWEITGGVYESPDTLIFVQMLWLHLALLTCGFTTGSASMSCPREPTRSCKTPSTKHSTKPATPSWQGYWKQTTTTFTLTQSPPRLSITSWFCCVQGLPAKTTIEALGVITRLLSLPYPQSAEQCL